MHLPPALAACLFMSAAGAALPALDGATATTGYLAEAPLAAGWPEPGIPGEVSEVTLPAYRAVEGPGFWPLFLHISAAEIPMTAPVVMPAVDDRSRSMRFVYPRADTTPAPVVDGLRIVDVPAQRALRLTRRGVIRPAEVDGLATQLRAEAARRGLTAAGDPALCGYNGPDVPRDRQTWELFLPVATP